MTLPEALRQAVATTLGVPGITHAARLGGGSIHHTYRIETAGEPYFLKWNRGEGARFGVEARSLERLRGAARGSEVRIPEVFGWSDGDGDAPGWLLLEFLEPSIPGAGYGRLLGAGLAGVHRSTAPGFGWPEDNLIGSLPQPNPHHSEWSTFWRDARLVPQLERARRRGLVPERAAGTLAAVIDVTRDALAPVADEPPSLLHGDLWGGNAHAAPDGRPVLVDPASYYGHREVDLAMSELFGGFPGDFLPAYREAWPQAEGYAEVRRPLYQLFYLLVHLNLFGASYLGACLDAARRVVSATRGGT